MKNFLFVFMLSMLAFSCSNDDNDEKGLLGTWELKQELVYHEPIDTVNDELIIDTLLYEFGTVMQLMKNDSVSIDNGGSITEGSFIYNEDEDLLYLVGLYFFNIEDISEDSLIMNRSIWEIQHRYFYERID